MAGPTTIDWGDGSPVEEGPEQGQVSHTYEEPGEKTATVCDTEDPNRCTEVTFTIPFGTGEDMVIEVTRNAGDATGQTVDVTVDNQGQGGVTITWGEGTPPTSTNAGDGTAVSTHAYPTPGEKTIEVVDTDDPERTGSATFTLPMDPTEEPTAAATADPENGLIANLDVSGFSENTSVVIDWGDGTEPETGVALTDGAATATHTYAADQAGQALTITVTGEQDATQTATAPFTPEGGDPGEPTATATADPENGLIANLDISGFAGNTSVTIDWGDGTEPDTAVALTDGAGTATHTYDAATAGTEQTITVTGEQDAAETATTTFTPEGDEPGEPTATATADPENGLVANLAVEGFDGNTSVTVDWGDGSEPETGVALTDGAGTATYTYDAAQSGTEQTITVTGEQDAAETATTTFTPEGEDPGEPAAEATADPENGLIANLDISGFSENTSVVIDWGDGTEPDTAVALTDGAATATHTYDAATSGTEQTITVTGEQDDTQTATAAFTPEGEAPDEPSAEATADAENGLIANLTFEGFSENTSVTIDWGDGTEPDTAVAATDGAGTATHTYDAATAGTEQAITVTGEQDDTQTATAAFTPEADAEPMDIAFVRSTTDDGSGLVIDVTVDNQGEGPVTITWGEGDPATDENPGDGTTVSTHTYPTPGEKTIDVVDNADPERTGSETATLPFMPTLAATAGAALAVTLTYDNAPNGTVSIDWGDGGEPETGQAESGTDIAHTYAEAGEYTITVTDEDDATLTGSTTVTAAA